MIDRSVDLIMGSTRYRASIMGDIGIETERITTRNIENGASGGVHERTDVQHSREATV